MPTRPSLDLRSVSAGGRHRQDEMLRNTLNGAPGVFLGMRTMTPSGGEGVIDDRPQPQPPKRPTTVYGNDSGDHRESAVGGADTSAVNSFGLYLFWNVLIEIFYGCNDVTARDWIDNNLFTDNLFPFKPKLFTPTYNRNFAIRSCMAFELQRRGDRAVQAGDMGSVAILLGASHDLMSQLRNEIWRAKWIEDCTDSPVRETFLHSSGGALSSVNHNSCNSENDTNHVPCMIHETLTGEHSYRTYFTRKGQVVGFEDTVHLMHVAHLSGRQIKKLLAKSYAGVWGQIVEMYHSTINLKKYTWI